MLVREFYDRFDTLSLDKKIVPIDRIGHGELTLYEIYMRLQRIDAQMRPFTTEREDLLKLAQEYLDNLPKPRLDYRE